MAGVQDETWFSVSEVADQLGVTIRTVRKWIHRKQLDAVQIGGRTGYKISGTALGQFINSRKVIGAAHRELDAGSAATS